jgi:glycosyltransferase involved in cell wall biosynthesis
MINTKKKLLFVGPCKFFFRSFMQWDFDALSKEFDVRLVNACFNVHDLQGTVKTPYSLVTGVAWADAIFCWFASREAFWAIALSQIFKRKTAVAAGGADVTAVPELRYGAALSKTKRFYSTYVLSRATKVLPYSKDAEEAALGLVHDASKVTRVYLGIDVEKFHPSDPKKDRVITVSVVSHSNLKRKGLETFVKSAAYLPNAEFVVVGQFADGSIDYLRSIAPKNVRFTGLLAERELIRCYQGAKVYVQVSAHEAFGVALAEAMACECTPVVTDRGAIPEVVGDAGIYVPYANPVATAAGITQALKSDKGSAARQRIKNMFTIDERQKALLKVINDLLN